MSPTYYTVEMNGRVLMSPADRYAPWQFPSPDEARHAGAVLARWEGQPYSVYIHVDDAEEHYYTGRGL